MSLRDSQFGELKVPLTWTAAVAVIVAGVAAVALLLSDRRETLQAQAYGATRGVADRVLTPVGDVLSAPARWTGDGVDAVRSYFFAVSENQQLKAELKEAQQWRDVAIALRNENNRYRTLLGLKIDPPIPMVAARVVTDSRGPFANTRLANAGREKGVKVGNPVMNENGMVGRIIGVTDGASRVLLLTDVASRTPVMIERTNARAILTGDGGPNPRLDYLRGRDPVREGDLILTSGDGGVAPRGLPVGVVVKGLDGKWRAALASDKGPIDIVRILLFSDFTSLVNYKQLDALPVPPPTPGAETNQPPAPQAPLGPLTAAAKAAAPGAAAPVAAAGAALAAKAAAPKAQSKSEPALKTAATARPGAKSGTSAASSAAKSAGAKTVEKSSAARSVEKGFAAKPASAKGAKTTTAKTGKPTAAEIRAAAARATAAANKSAEGKTAAAKIKAHKPAHPASAVNSLEEPPH